MNKRKFIELVNAGRVRRINLQGTIFYVSDEADVWSEVYYNEKQKTARIIERKFTPVDNVYQCVNYHNRERKAQKILVHRLVWLAFKGEIPQGLEIDHIDQNIHNNRLDNLQLTTHRENVRKARYQGRFRSRLRPVRVFIPGTEFYQDFESIAEAARHLKTRTSVINRAALKGYLHKGVRVQYIKPTMPCDTEARKARYEALKQQGQSNNSSCDTSR